MCIQKLTKIPKKKQNNTKYTNKTYTPHKLKDNNYRNKTKLIFFKGEKKREKNTPYQTFLEY